MAATQTEVLNTLRKGTKRQMDKHRTNYFCNRFSTCFSVCALSGTRREEAAQELEPAVSPGIQATGFLPKERFGDRAWPLPVWFAMRDCVCCMESWLPLSALFPFVSSWNLFGQQVALAGLWAAGLGPAPVIPGVSGAGSSAFVL